MTSNNEKSLIKVKLDEAQKLLQKKNKSKDFDAKEFSGKLKGIFGDPMDYQKKLRDEWE